MRTVHVGRSIPAPPERVFELLADHAARGFRRVLEDVERMTS
jgi:uncharacterized protein YndB with AHSA1/START domain